MEIHFKALQPIEKSPFPQNPIKIVFIKFKTAEFYALNGANFPGCKIIKIMSGVWFCQKLHVFKLLIEYKLKHVSACFN